MIQSHQSFDFSSIYYMVCEEHFDKEDDLHHRSGRLKKTAIPRYFLFRLTKDAEKGVGPSPCTLAGPAGYVTHVMFYDFA